MQSRMERYNSSNTSLESRVTKNKKVYDKIYGESFLDEERLPVTENINVIDMETLRKMTSGEKEVVMKKSEEHEDVKRNQKVYNINELLSQVKDEKRNVENAIKIERNFLNTLKSNDYVSDINEALKEEKLSKTTTLSLDILSDLKPTENTIVTEPIDDNVDIGDSNESLDKITSVENDFYSGSLDFKAKDFDFYFDKPKKSSIFKIVIILLLICFFVLLGFYLVKYFDINIGELLNK